MRPDVRANVAETLTIPENRRASRSPNPHASPAPGKHSEQVASSQNSQTPSLCLSMVFQENFHPGVMSMAIMTAVLFSSSAAWSPPSFTVTDFPQTPVLSFPRTSGWSFSYNPAYLPASQQGGPEGLLVRVQNNSFATGAKCAGPGPPSTVSSVAFAPITDNGTHFRLGGAEAVVFEPEGTWWEGSAEDPRVLSLQNGTFLMTYTAIGAFPPCKGI